MAVKLQSQLTCGFQAIKKGFMAITTHFIDANWSLQSRVIRYCFCLFNYNLLVFLHINDIMFILNLL